MWYHWLIFAAIVIALYMAARFVAGKLPAIPGTSL